MSWSARKAPRPRGPSSPSYLASVLGVLAVFVYLGSEFVAIPWTIAGPSMNPALREGDRVLVDVWSYRSRTPRIGEIVLFRGPSPAEVPLVKRVATPPPFPRDRPLPDLWRGGDAPGPGLWMLGDNPGRSLDSREFGAVPALRVVGRAAWRYWPPSRMGRIR